MSVSDYIIGVKNYTQVEEKWDGFLKDIGFTKKVEEQTIDKTLVVIKGLQKNIPSVKLSADTGMPLEKVEKIRQEVYG